MEFKENVNIILDDIWYDLTIGGYIKPRNLLKNEEDIIKVEEAIKTIEGFLDSAREQGKVTEV